MNDKLKIILFGATGMVGRGVLLECLNDERIEGILAVNRSSLKMEHSKYKEVVHQDFLNYEAVESDLKGYDACFFCLGVSAVGMSEENYTVVTHDYTLAAATKLKALNPEIKFTYVSGAGTDSSEKGRSMWARVKGRTENDLLKLGFRDAYMFRPGYIQPLKGVKSKTGWYNALYVVFKRLYPIFKILAPNSVTTTVNVGRAMIYTVVIGDEMKILESKDINRLAGMNAE